jgi:hypothetical protein
MTASMSASIQQMIKLHKGIKMWTGKCDALVDHHTSSTTMHTKYQDREHTHTLHMQNITGSKASQIRP